MPKNNTTPPASLPRSNQPPLLPPIPVPRIIPVTLPQAPNPRIGLSQVPHPIKVPVGSVSKAVPPAVPAVNVFPVSSPVTPSVLGANTNTKTKANNAPASMVIERGNDVEMQRPRSSSSSAKKNSASHDYGEPITYDLPANASSILCLVVNRDVSQLSDLAKRGEGADRLMDLVKLDLTAWKAQRKVSKGDGDSQSLDTLVTNCVHCVGQCCRCCCCCCRCLCPAEQPSINSAGSTTTASQDRGDGVLRGYRRTGEGELVEDWFDPDGHTLLGIAARMHSYEVLHKLLELAANDMNGKPKKDPQGFIDRKDAKQNTAAFYASKLYNWESEKHPSNDLLKLLVKDCGASFVVPETAHFSFSNDVMFLFASVFVVIGYIICVNWAKIMASTVGTLTAVNTDCNTIYGIALKPIFLTYLDAATIRILQYFTANPRYNWLLKPAHQALEYLSGGGKINADVLMGAAQDKAAQVQNQLADRLQAVQNPTLGASSVGSATLRSGGGGGSIPQMSELHEQASNSLSEQLDKEDGNQVFDDMQEQYEGLQEKREEAEENISKAKKMTHKVKKIISKQPPSNEQRPSIADDYDEEDDGSGFCTSPYHKLPNPPVDDTQLGLTIKSAKKKREDREKVLKDYVTEASAFDDVSGRMSAAIRSNPKMIFIFVQCVKFMFSTIFAMAKAKTGSTTLRSYVNFYGLIMNGDLPTVIFSLLAPVHMDLEVLHELDDNKGIWGLFVTAWHIFLYFWHRFCDIFSYRKFGLWSYVMMFPFIMLVPPFFSHFCVAGMLYFWIGLICLVMGLAGWRLKGIFFCLLRCFGRCGFDVWFLLYVVIEIFARFGFVVYCQVLYNVMSVIYLQDEITNPKNYMFALTWTWHLSMNPQCFAQNKDVTMLLIYLSSF